MMATSLASAVTITGTISFSTSLATQTASSATPQNFNLGQFNQTAINSAITAACTPGHVCSASTFTAIDFQLSVNVTDKFIAQNTTAGTLRVNVGGPDAFGGSQTYSEAVQADLIMFDPNLYATAESLPTYFNPSSVAVAANTTKTVSGTVSDTQTGHVNVPTRVLTTSVNNSSNTATLSSGDISTYIGSGTVTYELDLSSGVHIPGTTPSGMNTGSDSVLNSGTAMITYTYTYTDTNVAPEPTTMVLFGSALLGIGMLRKRSRS